MDDEALMDKVRSGDEQAFSCLVMRYQGQITRFTQRMLGNFTEAQDAAQETFIRLWMLRDRYRFCGGLKSYLFRIARNICLDMLRRSKIQVSLEGEDEIRSNQLSIEGHVMQRTFSSTVKQAILNMPEPARAVFCLSHYEGLTYREIAEIMDCPIGTVASRKASAVEMLRRRFAAWNEEEGANGL